MLKCWLCLLLTVLWNGDIAAGLQQRHYRRWKTTTHACSSAEVGSRVQNISKVQQIQSSDLGSLKAARSEAFESEVRRLAVPVLIKGTHTPTPKRDVCLAVQDVPGMPVPSRVIHDIALAQQPRKPHQNVSWRRSIQNVSWRTFCNQIADYEVQTEKHGVASSVNGTPTIPLYAKLPIPEEINAAGYAGLFFYTPSHGPHYRRSMLWMGSKGAQTPLHEDPLDNIASQLSGKKRWHLFSPDHFREVDYLNFQEPWSHIGGQCSWNAIHGGVRWSNYSMITQKEVPPVPSHLVVEVQAGDSLYIPGFWGHMVESLETSVMTNYWFHDMWSCCNGHGGIAEDNTTKTAAKEISGTGQLKSESALLHAGDHEMDNHTSVVMEISGMGQLASQTPHT